MRKKYKWMFCKSAIETEGGGGGGGRRKMRKRRRRRRKDHKREKV